jgi:DDE superfamily endonuclease
VYVGKGRPHDFKILAQSKVNIHLEKRVVTDSGYLGLQRTHLDTAMPKKRSKLHPLTKQDKKNNRELSSLRVTNEHVIGSVKRFKIVADRYRNRRKRFGLRFNIIAGIHNYELRNKEK